jgi:hypothetical protein
VGSTIVSTPMMMELATNYNGMQSGIDRFQMDC